MQKEPDYHHRYRVAWEEYCTNFDHERKLQLEKEMDSAQNHFGWYEFHAFKATLPGYVEYWQFLATDGARRYLKSEESWKRTKGD